MTSLFIIFLLSCLTAGVRNLGSAVVRGAQFGTGPALVHSDSSSGSLDPTATAPPGLAAGCRPNSATPDSTKLLRGRWYPDFRCTKPHPRVFHADAGPPSDPLAE